MKRWRIEDGPNTRPGDWISEFMGMISLAERICVVLSPKYLESMYCMRELLGIYQHSVGDKKSFLKGVLSLVVEEVKISKTVQRLSHVRHWQIQRDELNSALDGIDRANWGNAGRELTTICDFCHHTDEMLSHLQDHIMPRGLHDIEKDDFSLVLEALKRKAVE